MKSFDEGKMEIRLKSFFVENFLDFCLNFIFYKSDDMFVVIFFLTFCTTVETITDTGIYLLT